MMRWAARGCCAILFIFMCCLAGCIPADNHVDEEKDPHFQRGRNLVSSQDFKGAVEEFEAALQTNPRSAAAHFELGWLYDTKINDYAAAIYHYERHLQLQPNSERAALVKERIRGCKQELANSEFPLPDSQNLQREVDRLTVENVALKRQLDEIRNAPPTQNLPPSNARQTQVEGARTVDVSRAGHPRVHVIKAHDTIRAIAAQYGIKASVLLAANPHVDPRKLRVGQSLNLP